MSDTNRSERKSRAKKILKVLKKEYGNSTCELDWSSPLELLIATILSAQCTDERVNKITPDLFARYRSAKDYAEADPSEIQEIIHSAGFFRQKTKSIINACSDIVSKFNGKVPDTMEELVSLHGVARKTANVVLGTAYGKNEGIAVDTHVGRMAVRLELTSTSDTKNAILIEKELMELFPRKDWAFLSHSLVLHGRYVCTAKNPKHAKCALAKLCPAHE